MNKTSIKIEIFCAPNCNRCGKAVDLVEQLVQELNDESILCQKLNVVDELDYAVHLGILATPAIVINGKLEFTAMPNKQSLGNKLMELM